METMFQADAEKMMLDEASETQYLEISLRYAEALKALRDSDMGRMAKFSELKSIRKNKNAASPNR